MRLEGKIAIITGAGSGIGRASAIAFANQAAKVVCLDINADGLRATQAEIDAQGGTSRTILVDMTDPDAVASAFAATTERFGRIDVVFNVAGASGRRWGDGPVAECTVEGWQRTIDVNLTSVFLGSQHAVRQMLLQPEGGSLINLSSVLGMVGGDADFGTHAYAAAKSGIIGLTRAIATYYASQKIRANVIAPGLIATGMSKRAQSSDKIRTRLADLQPLTSDFGQPEDVAMASLYLASDESRFMTGTVLTVDGGWTAY